MRKIVTAVILFAISVGCGLYAATPSAACPTIFRILAYAFAAFGLWNFIAGVLRSRPYRRAVHVGDWQIRAEPVSSNRDVVVVIAASEHRKGTAPKYEFLRNGVIDRTMPLVAEVAANGDISIVHAANSFMPPWREFGIEVRG